MSRWVAELELLLVQQHHPQQSRAMAAYMKHRFSFLGIKSPERRVLLARHLKTHPVTSPEQLVDVVDQLWQKDYRELHYCALDILSRRQRLLTPDHLDFLERLVCGNAWWDSVDLLASKIIGAILLRHPEHLGERTAQWIQNENLWLRRSALLCQLKWKANTDWPLLSSLILKCRAEEDFFIRKAIGWALREYAKTEPELVKQWVAVQNLSPLSVREALKHLQ